jgi:SAM-dependent methyltransferase
VVGDARALPFRDNVFDRVFAFNVFEDLRQLSLAACEIHRVLKPGGSLVLHTPFLQPLHEAPHHYFSATEYGVRGIRQDANERRKLSAAGTPPARDLPHPGFYVWFDEPLDWTKLARRFRVSGWSGPLLVRAERGGARSLD